MNHENTAEFDNSQQSDPNVAEDSGSQRHEESDDEDRPPEVTNVNGSAFFSRDFRVLKNATYGTPDQAYKIEQELMEQYGHIETSRTELEQQHEQNLQSFAEPPPEEPESELMQEIDPELEEIGNGQMLGTESPLKGSFN